MFRHWINKIDLDPETPEGAGFDIFLQAMIVVSLVGYSVETLPDLSNAQRSTLDWIEGFCVVVFGLEYMVRLLQAKRKRDFVFSFFGIVDLLSILPYFLMLGPDFLALRSLRLVRLFRLLKLVRYNRAIERFRLAFDEIKAELTVYLVGVLLFFFVASSVIYQCEHAEQPDKFTSIFHSMWWTIITLSTVGYGDVYPQTSLGKVFTGLILLVGLGTVPIPSGLIAAALMKGMKKDG